MLAKRIIPCLDVTSLGALEYVRYDNPWKHEGRLYITISRVIFEDDAVVVCFPRDDYISRTPYAIIENNRAVEVIRNNFGYFTADGFIQKDSIEKLVGNMN